MVLSFHGRLDDDAFRDAATALRNISAGADIRMLATIDSRALHSTNGSGYLRYSRGSKKGSSDSECSDDKILHGILLFVG